MQFWAPQSKEDVGSTQRKATKLVEGLKVMSYEERLRMLGSSGLEKRRPRGDLAAPHSSLRGGTEGGAGLCSLRPDVGTHGEAQTGH